jgi:hypothetical protein
MEVRFDHLDKAIQEQIDKLIASEGTDPVNSRDIHARQWIERESIFLKHAETLVPGQSVKVGSRSAFLILTVSGSLVGVSPDQAGVRTVIYYSSGLRKRIPDQLVMERVKPVLPVVVGSPLVFLDGPIKKTSNVYRIAAFPESAGNSMADTIETVKKKTMMITREWEAIANG